MKRDSSWRPEDWDRINPKPVGVSLGYAFNREDLYNHGEAIADAMLKTIKEYVVNVGKEVGRDDLEFRIRVAAWLCG